MFKKTITYKDFNDKEVTQDFYFHISKADLLGMAVGGRTMMQRIQRIIAAEDGIAIINELREFVRLSCGLRSDDGSRFITTPEAKSVLMDSPALDELLMEIATDAKAAASFVNQLVPQKMQEELQAQGAKAAAENEEASDSFKEQEDLRPAWMKENRYPTPDELKAMSTEELKLAFQRRFEQPESK